MSDLRTPWKVCRHLDDEVTQIDNTDGAAVADVYAGSETARTEITSLVLAAPGMRQAIEWPAGTPTPDFLEWIADRLVNQYGEHPDVDFVLSLRARAAEMRKSISNCKSSA